MVKIDGLFGLNFKGVFKKRVNDILLLLWCEVGQMIGIVIG